MLEYLKFSIGSMDSGYKTVALWNENGAIEYEILRSGLLDVARGKQQAKMSDDCLDRYEALGIASWDAVYDAPEVHPGDDWRLTVQENGATYKISGSGAYPAQWQSFMEWLDALMPEMEFISPKRVETVILRCRDAGLFGIHHERLEINRFEQTARFEKWGEPKCEEAASAYSVQSSHHYDFSAAGESLDALMNQCQQFFDPLAFEEEGVFARKYARFQVWLKLHDGSTMNGHADAFVPGWLEFLGAIHQYFCDLTANIFQGEQRPIPQRGTVPNAAAEYIYCKVRFKNSYRQYSYRTEDETLQVGDWVDVPVGQENKVICGRIEKIERFDEAHAPYPVNKTKLIIGKHKGAAESEEGY